MFIMYIHTACIVNIFANKIIAFKLRYNGELLFSKKKFKTRTRYIFKGHNLISAIKSMQHAKGMVNKT